MVFAGKQALVVGGTGGIGRGIALSLAERGAGVTITGGSSQERLDTALTELDKISKERFPKASHSGFLCFIGPEGLSPEKAAVLILERASPDLLVLAWGPFSKIPLEETKPRDWRFLTETNLIFPGIMISSVLCAMINKGWGRILLFGGTKTGDLRGFSGTVAYSAAKTALGVLAKSVAKRAGNAGVTCNVICPGLTDTEYTNPEEQAYNRSKTPGGKALKSEEITHLAMELLENPVLNGAIISADRGLWV